MRLDVVEPRRGWMWLGKPLERIDLRPRQQFQRSVQLRQRPIRGGIGDLPIWPASAMQRWEMERSRRELRQGRLNGKLYFQWKHLRIRQGELPIRQALSLSRRCVEQHRKLLQRLELTLGRATPMVARCERHDSPSHHLGFARGPYVSPNCRMARSWTTVTASSGESVTIQRATSTASIVPAARRLSRR